jgi:hypothetical protein
MRHDRTLSQRAVERDRGLLQRVERDRFGALGRIRYCTRIRGDRVEVSRYTGEADYRLGGWLDEDKASIGQG